MALRTQLDPNVLIGDTIADRPNPAAQKQGLLFYEVNSGDSWILVIDPATGVRSWEEFGGHGGRVRFTATMLQQLFVGNPGSGANQHAEPIVHVSRQDVVGMTALNVGRLDFRDSGQGGYVYTGIGQVGGPDVVPGAMVFRGAPLADNLYGNDIDIGWAPQLNAAGTNTLSVLSAQEGDNTAQYGVAQSQDNGATFVVLPPVVPPASTTLDRPWLAMAFANTLLSYSVADSGVWVFRSDVFGAPQVPISQVLPASDYRIPEEENETAAPGNLVIDHNNFAGVVPGPAGQPGFRAAFTFTAPATPLSDPTLSNQIFVFVSIDGGFTWQEKAVFASPPPTLNLTAFAMLSFAPNGDLWVVWNDNTNVFVQRSIDLGTTWSPPALISTTTTFARISQIVATDQGIAAAFYGTQDPTDAERWQMFYTQNLSGDPAGPWSSPVSVAGVVHTGTVCGYGSICPSLADRILLEAFGLDIDSLGYAHIAYTADGFDQTDPLQTARSTFYAVQTTGPTLGHTN